MNPVVHFEMQAVDRARVADFYSKVFGWNMHQLGAEMGNYVLAHTAETDQNNMVQRPGAINGGFYTKGDAPAMQGVHVVISVPDYKESMKKIADGGGTIEGAPMEIPGIGWYVSFIDTEGNRVGILQAAPRQ